jgi:hypothetical protein
MKPKLTVEMVAKAVLEGWLAGKDGVSVEDLAVALLVSAGTVRRFMNEHQCMPEGCRYTHAYKERFDRNYGQPLPPAKVQAWRPEEDAIRDEIKRLRAKVSR